MLTCADSSSSRLFSSSESTSFCLVISSSLLRASAFSSAWNTHTHTHIYSPKTHTYIQQTHTHSPITHTYTQTFSKHTHTHIHRPHTYTHTNIHRTYTHTHSTINHTHTHTHTLPKPTHMHSTQTQHARTHTQNNNDKLAEAAVRTECGSSVPGGHSARPVLKVITARGSGFNLT